MEQPYAGSVREGTRRAMGESFRQVLLGSAIPFALFAVGRGPTRVRPGRGVAAGLQPGDAGLGGGRRPAHRGAARAPGDGWRRRLPRALPDLQLDAPGSALRLLVLVSGARAQPEPGQP